MALPGVGPVAVWPDHLEEWERRLAVVVDRGAEECFVPAVVHRFEQDRDACDIVAFLFGLQGLAFNGLPAAEVVEDCLHEVDVQAEHGQVGHPVAVPKADGVRPAGSLVVTGDHRDLPAMLLYEVNGRLHALIQFIAVMTKDTVAGGVAGGHDRQGTGAILPRWVYRVELLACTGT